MYALLKRVLLVVLFFLFFLAFYPKEVFAITDIVATSSTTLATQPSTMRHIARTSEATFHAFVQMGTNTTKCGSGGLWWLYSTNSGSTWTCGSQLSSDTTNLMYADARADSSDNLYLVYSVATSGASTSYDVFYRKLTASNCSPAPCDWTVESAQTVLDGDGAGDNAGFHYATIELQGTTRAWIAAREFDGTNNQVGVYYSDSLGLAPTWTVSQATLDTAGTSTSHHFPTLVRFGSNIGVIYNLETVHDLAWRYRADGDGLTAWNAQATISTTYFVRFPAFSAVGDTSGNVYLAANGSSSLVHFSHYLSSWSTIAVVSSTASSDQFASVATDNTNVWVLYTDTSGLANMVTGKLVYKKGVPPFATANFDTNPTSVVSYHNTFDKVWLYDASASTYEEETTDAASTATADVAHSSSSSVVKDIDDIVYFGKSTTFDAISWKLSTAGTGSGTLTWEYCSAIDGASACTTWSTLTFTTSGNLHLKIDNDGAFTPPSNWQAAKVNSEGTAYYYIRARTTIAYTIGPVGTQFRTIPEIRWPALAASTAGVYGLWTENEQTPKNIRYATILSHNSNPNSPSSLGGHVSGSFTNDTTPTLTFTLSDPDSADTVKYRIQIDDSSDFSSAVVDYTSALASQGSMSFTVGQAAGSGSYTTGSSGQTLSDGNYYWRVKAIDDDSAESSYSTANSGQIAFKIDATVPVSLDLNSPGDFSYTSSERPIFKWKATSDATAGLSKYVLEIDNPSLGSTQPSGDFTIDNIPTDRTSDYETPKYLIHYENFSDSDSTNNYISVYTKSSTEWSTDSNSGQNDGKLREGKVSWKVKAIDNAANETSSSWTLFVDRSIPKVEITQINATPFTSTSFSTTDGTPTIFGKITDPLGGGDPSQTQDENGPKVASGPKNVEIKFEKRNLLGSYSLHSLATLNLSESYWSDTGAKVTDNSKNRADKYTNFSFTPTENLNPGTYRVTITGKDTAENTSSSFSFSLRVTTQGIITFPEEEVTEELVEKEVEEKPEGLVEIPDLEPVAQNIFSRLATALRDFYGKLVDAIEAFAEANARLVVKMARFWQAYSNFVYGTNQKILAFIDRQLETAGRAIAIACNFIAQKVPTVTVVGKTIANVGKKAIEPVSQFANKQQVKLSSIAEILFDKSPTVITNVKVVEVGKDYAVITWETNHLTTNNKINYGESLSYGQEVLSQERSRYHEFRITGLETNKRYFFEVMSKNNNYVYDAYHEFTTKPE